jgi:hypothetical protein
VSRHAHVYLRPPAHQQESKSVSHRQQRLDAELLRLRRRGQLSAQAPESPASAPLKPVLR